VIAAPPVVIATPATASLAQQRAPESPPTPSPNQIEERLLAGETPEQPLAVGLDYVLERHRELGTDFCSALTRISITRTGGGGRSSRSRVER